MSEAKNASPRRPPIPTAASSGSSLPKTSQAAPSFQNFVKRTPPPADKPLPPFPSFLRRASSSSIPQSRSISPFAERRCSSVYSRTASQWGRDDISWHSADFADEPVPPLPILQPLAYSASSPHLVAKQPTPPLLEARRYSPLISTPSPTASRVSTPGWIQDTEYVDSVAHVSKAPPVAINVLHTVPLETAILAVHAPGAVHLLPEELRARTVARSRSQQPTRMPAYDNMSSAAPPQLPQPPVLIDHQGRQRSLRAPSDMLVISGGYPFPTVTTQIQPLDPAMEAAKRSREGSATISRKGSNTAPNVQNVDEPRGRTMKRGSRNQEANPYLAKKLALDTQVDAPLTAEEYRALLPQQSRTASASPGYGGFQSEGSATSNLKLIPDPLFQSKPPAKMPGGIDRIDHEKSASPYRFSDSNESRDVPPPGVAEIAFPSAYTMAQESTHRRTSTSGSIPISPPTLSTVGLDRGDTQPLISNPKTRRRRPATRASAYYPHVASRKAKAGRMKAKPLPHVEKIPPMPFLSSSRKKGGATGAKKATKVKVLSTASVLGDDDDDYDGDDNEDDRRPSDASSHKPQQPFHQRFAKNVAKYADLFTPSDSTAQTGLAPITAATVSPDSPHLLPSPVDSKPKEVHLGWSDLAKNTFDKVISPGSLRCKPSVSTTAESTSQYTHLTTPARPLDESTVGLGEGDMVRRKSSIFGTFVESWRENRAERRREELKKTIRVIPQAQATSLGRPSVVLGRSNSVGWM